MWPRLNCHPPYAFDIFPSPSGKMTASPCRLYKETTFFGGELPNPRMSVLERTSWSFWSQCGKFVSVEGFLSLKQCMRPEPERRWKNTVVLLLPGLARRGCRPPHEVHTTSSATAPLTDGQIESMKVSSCASPDSQGSQICLVGTGDRFVHRSDQRRAGPI